MNTKQLQGISLFLCLCLSLSPVYYKLSLLSSPQCHVLGHVLERERVEADDLSDVPGSRSGSPLAGIGMSDVRRVAIGMCAD